jgi:23S rRNA (uracil1939-C5)-methyltransferase
VSFSMPPVVKRINCPHFSHCSGCSINEFVDQPGIYSKVKNFFVSKGIPLLPLHSGSTTGWRNRAKLAVRGSSDSPSIGLFAEGTHHIIDIPCCRVHHPNINRGIEAVRRMILEKNIVPYEEKSGNGDLRYLQFVVERETERVQLSLVFNKNPEDGHKGHWKHFFSTLWNDHRGLWHSFWLNFTTRRDNVIFGSSWFHLHGDQLLWEFFRGVAVCSHPASFAQANSEMFKLLLDKIEPHIPEQAAVVEFYAGVGVIGLVMAPKCRKVICCEINPQAITCFEEAQQRLPKEVAQIISFHVAAAGDMCRLCDDAEVVIVNPPRKGLDRLLLKALQSSTKLNKIIYISCGWEAFQRDCNDLLASMWKLVTAESFLFFPGTDHLEILAVFEK